MGIAALTQTQIQHALDPRTATAAPQRDFVVVHQPIAVPDVNRRLETVPVIIVKRSAHPDRAALRGAITPVSEARSETAVHRLDTAVETRVIAEMGVRVDLGVVIRPPLLRL